MLGFGKEQIRKNSWDVFGAKGVFKIFSYLIFHIYLFWERERGVGRGRERRERLQSRFHAVSAKSYTGLDLTNHEIMTWAKIKSRILNQLSDPGTPCFCFLTILFFKIISTPNERLELVTRSRVTLNHWLSQLGAPKWPGFYIVFSPFNWYKGMDQWCIWAQLECLKFLSSNWVR